VNALVNLFLKGLAVTIPAVLTISIVWWLAAGAERLLRQVIVVILPEHWYLPGMGLLSAVALILLVGLLSHVLLFQRLFEWGELLLNRLPLVKSIYSAIKDFIGYFDPDRRRDFSKVVMVQIPGQEFQMLGFVTREQFDDLSLKPNAENPVAVYLPMSYQVGGYTLYLPRSTITPVDISFEQAMRLALTGGVTANQRGVLHRSAEESAGSGDEPSSA
jgi:uncharacterized membrane protein